MKLKLVKQGKFLGTICDFYVKNCETVYSYSILGLSLLNIQAVYSKIVDKGKDIFMYEGRKL